MIRPQFKLFKLLLHIQLTYLTLDRFCWELEVSLRTCKWLTYSECFCTLSLPRVFNMSCEIGKQILISIIGLEKCDFWEEGVTIYSLDWLTESVVWTHHELTQLDQGLVQLSSKHFYQSQLSLWGSWLDSAQLEKLLTRSIS